MWKTLWRMFKTCVTSKYMTNVNKIIHTILIFNIKQCVFIFRIPIVFLNIMCKDNGHAKHVRYPCTLIVVFGFYIKAL